MGVVGALKKRSDAYNLNQAYNEFDAVTDRQDFNDLMSRMENGEDVSAEIHQRLDDVVAAMDRVADTGGASDQPLAVVADALRSIQPHLLDYHSKTQALADAGGADPATLTSAAAIEDRLILLDDAIESIRAFAKAYSGQEAMIRAGLIADGLSAVQVDFIISEWESGARPALVQELRDLEILAYQELKAVLVFLRDRFGIWSVDGDGYIVLDRAMDMAAYDVLAQSSDDAISAYEAKQQAYIRVIGSR